MKISDKVKEMIMFVGFAFLVLLAFIVAISSTVQDKKRTGLLERSLAIQARALECEAK